MSSPFASFRKHRTYWMAGLVLLAILAFIVAPAIDSMMDYMRSSEQPENEVVVRWSDGKITTGTLNYVRTQHARTVRFLQALAREVVDKGGMPKVPGFRYDMSSKRVEALGLPVLDNNRAVCQTLIIAQRAKQLGIEFNQEVTEDFIRRFCDRKITNNEFKQILKDTTGHDLSVSELYRQLSLELSAVVMQRVALAGVNYEEAPLVTPGGLWQNYLQLNQSARIEAYPILTSDFVKQVQETPTEAEIRQLYDTGAGNFASPSSPQPGFRRRYQANIEYVSGSWNQLLEVEKAKISEEALRAEYERLVGLGGLQVPADAPKPNDQKPEEAKPEEAKPEEAKPEEAKPEEAKPEEAKADAKPEEDEPQEAEPDGAEPDGEEPKENEPAADDEAPAEGAPAADPKSQSRAARPDAQVRLVAFQQDGQENQDALPPEVGDPPAPENLNEAAPAADAPAQDAPEDAPQTNDEPKAAETQADAAGAVAAEAGASAVQSSTPAQAAAAQPGNAPMRTQTFEEAKDSLARSLAMNVVRDQLQAKLTKIETAMNAYSSKKSMERISAQTGRKTEGEPATINLKKLAEAEGLNYSSTGMTDIARLASTPIGRSMIGNQALANTIMTSSVELNRPVRSMFIDMENVTEPDFQEFVSWKIDEVPSYTPALDDIREEVVEAWKMQRARVLADDEAKRLADKLKAAGDEPWKSVLDAQQQTLVISPPPFTWMSAPREMFAPAQITFVQGLDSVGQEFMQRVFSTSAGQVTVAPNQGLSTYYVVRLLELTPTTDQLRQNFEISRGRARQLAFPERERMYSDWYENIERKLNVEWLASEESLMN